MPCGGIFPTNDRAVERGPLGIGRGCYHCAHGGLVDHALIEWDAALHAACIPMFLKTPDGAIVLKHQHVVVRRGVGNLAHGFIVAVKGGTGDHGGEFCCTCVEGWHAPTAVWSTDAGTGEGLAWDATLGWEVPCCPRCNSTTILANVEVGVEEL